MIQEFKKVHFIAIGGSVMHQLAIALQEKGIEVSGSDDEIYEPAKSSLQEHGILPDQVSWDAAKITKQLDAIILGMHAKADNPELLKAQELGIRIYSFPEFIYACSTDKQRVVIAGSHGKTTITSMVMHVLKKVKKPFDYLVGAQVRGFEQSVTLTNAPIIIIEGDEYLSSPLDRRAKFHHYHHHIGLISGIEWDHINVYPTFEDYNQQFETFAENTPDGGILIYCQEDKMVEAIGKKERNGIKSIAYRTHTYSIENGIYFLNTENCKVPVQVFGAHNMQNISAAKAIVKSIGVENKDFYSAIQSFEGAGKRLDILAELGSKAVFKDYAHAPSKVRATIKAVKERNPDRKLVAVVELHTFSSLHPDFIQHYQNTTHESDKLVIFINPKNLKIENTDHLEEKSLKKAFNREDAIVIKDPSALSAAVIDDSEAVNYLMMSSGTFAGLNFEQLAKQLTK